MSNRLSMIEAKLMLSKERIEQYMSGQIKNQPKKPASISARNQRRLNKKQKKGASYV